MQKLPKINFLVSYPFFNPQVRRALSEMDPSRFRLILDSGAFSVYNSNISVDINKYAEFVKTLPKEWEWKAVQLDVFGDAEKTYENFLRMVDMDVDVMPVFTRGDSLERLEEYYKYTDYIMFGGIVVGGQNRNYIKWFCEKNKGRKAHWLGFAHQKFVRYFKPESVDSTTHTNCQRFGRMDLYDNYGAFHSYNRKSFSNKPTQKAIKTFQKQGFGDVYTKLKYAEAWKGTQYFQEREFRGLASFITYANHLLRAIDIERKIKTKIYLACGDAKQIQILRSAYDHLLQRRLI